MEERRGNGIFLGVVSVATLIVAIIGATFAYFSASTESAENAVNLGAYEFKLSLSMSQVYPTNASAASGLIPLIADAEITGAEHLAPNNTNLMYAINAAPNRCIDSNGLQVCALYKVTIENSGSNPVTLSGMIKTTSNNPGEGEGKTPFDNLTYQAVTGALDSLTFEDDPIDIIEEGQDVDTQIADIEIDGATIDPVTGEVKEKGIGETYVLIYLNDSKKDQSGEMGATYTGQLIYTSGTGTGNTLTGTFTVGGTAGGESSASTEDAG